MPKKDKSWAYKLGEAIADAVHGKKTRAPLGTGTAEAAAEKLAKRKKRQEEQLKRIIRQ